MSLRKSSSRRNGSKSVVLPKPNARRRCTPAPSMVGLERISFLTGRRDIVAFSFKVSRLGDDLLPNVELVGMGGRMAFWTSGPVVTPMLTDVGLQIRFAECVLRRREYDYGRLATCFRASEKHNVIRQIARAFRSICFWKSLERFHERPSKFAACRAGVIDVNAVLGGNSLQPKDRFERGKPLTRRARTLETNHFADWDLRHAGDSIRLDFLMRSGESERRGHHLTAQWNLRTRNYGNAFAGFLVINDVLARF